MTGVERKIVFALASMAVWGVALPAAAETHDKIGISVTRDTVMADETKSPFTAYAEPLEIGLKNIIGIQVSQGAALDLGKQSETITTAGGSIDGDGKWDIISLEVKDQGSSLLGGAQTTIQAIQETDGTHNVIGLEAQAGTAVTLGEQASITATVNPELVTTGSSGPYKNTRSYGMIVNGSVVELGPDATVESSNGYDATGVLTQNEGGKTTLGDSARIQVSSPAGFVTGIFTKDKGTTILGRNVVVAADASVAAYGINTGSQGKTVAGDGLSVTADNKGDGFTYAIFTSDNGNAEIGDDASLTATNRNGGSIAGIDTESGGTASVGNRASITVSNTGGNAIGISSYGGTTLTGTDTSITVNSLEGMGIYTDSGTTSLESGSIAVNGKGGMGIVSYNNGYTVAGDHTSITVTGEKSEDLGGSKGIYSFYDGITSLGNNASITVTGSEGTGIVSEEGGKTIVGENASVTVKGENGVGISSLSQGITSLLDNATVAAEGRGVESKTSGAVIFAGSANIMGGQYSLFSQDTDSIIDLTAAGTRKTIQGNMLASNGGTIRAVLDTGDSFFTGASGVEGEGSELELDLANGARWNMTGDSSVTHLTLDSGAMVNMAANPAYQQLSADTFRGSNGIFYMKTDLDSQIDGDKVHLKEAEDGASGKIQVYDASFARGKEVTGTRHLLLVTDDRGRASFTGENLNRGGLWDVTPTIQNGSYVRNSMGVTDAQDTEWYLTKLEKTVNADTRPVLNSGDSVYGFYRLSLDTLRQRRGNLRQRKFQSDDADGLWARNRGGRFSGPGFTSRYNLFQLGYDVHHNPGSVYGFFGERGIASPDYQTGSGREHTLAGGLYGTWYGSHGSYTDVVARVGRDDSHISTWGPYPDKADYRTREQSLSVEYGKTLYLDKDKELFLEPQSQLVLGHLSSTRYTTSRGTDVYREGYNSAIGRMGILIGKSHNEGKHPFDYYGKVSWLHEFGGAQTVAMAARNGETLDTAVDHGDSWWEAGFGGTYRFSPKIQGYADVSRTFSSQIRTKWQVNAGVSWQF
ncbi:autotransporter outer membrane beta-barrel domain-containing protein [uncultured Acidaminococcus sp.]|uniref:autotransporter outer membrane beta-barrel domain-containing protein n=1 Tax=uncultured Acidaminococcus sp. TaxID=352152 RepID=UPI0028056746|nr:autotransporter outer membrane beta-barrel domain-containing protein [uncultured Acidaminococcus sp.]